jgi:hypothetical protein
VHPGNKVFSPLRQHGTPVTCALAPPLCVSVCVHGDECVDVIVSVCVCSVYFYHKKKTFRETRRNTRKYFSTKQDLKGRALKPKRRRRYTLFDAMSELLQPMIRGLLVTYARTRPNRFRRPTRFFSTGCPLLSLLSPGRRRVFSTRRRPMRALARAASLLRRAVDCTPQLGSFGRDAPLVSKVWLWHPAAPHFPTRPHIGSPAG